MMEVALRQMMKLSIAPLKMIRLFHTNNELIKQLTWREVQVRYKGSYLGILWSFITPLLMLAVYTFVYSEVFKSRWPAQGDNKMQFALIIFAGLTTFNIFAEVVTRSPGLIQSNINYVKKVVFPLEILPVTILGSALVQGGISYAILILGLLITQHYLFWTCVLIPLILLPIILLSLGLSWFLAAAGVFLRDIGQIIGVAVQALMLLSPIFYPVEAIPQFMKFMFWANPLASVVENMRKVAVFGELPDWSLLISHTLIGSFFCLFGFLFFRRLKGGFADVL